MEAEVHGHVALECTAEFQEEREKTEQTELLDYADLWRPTQQQLEYDFDNDRKYEP